MTAYRKTGPIPRITRSHTPSRILVFDTEAYRDRQDEDTEYQTFRMAVARLIHLDKSLTITKDEWYDCQSIDALYGYITTQSRKDKTLYIYAHNLMYDVQLSGFLTLCLASGWRLTQFVIDNPPTYIKLRKHRTSMLLVDTFNYWQTSLEEMGKTLGLAKLDLPEDTAPYVDWITYCKRDVMVLSEYLLSYMRFLLVNNLAPMGLTLASQSFRAYRHRFMPDSIILHKDKHATLLERDAYTGGRVEAFYIGELSECRYEKADVNSMYPYVMKTNVMPVELVSYSENLPIGRIEKLLYRYYCIADCLITTEEPAYAVRHNHKLIFPVGTFRAVLHNADLLRVLAMGQLKALYRLAIYRMENIFDEYVSFLYNLKQQAEISGDKIARHQAKIMNNSLYGKFGQQNTITYLIDNPGEAEYGRMPGYSQQLGKRVMVNYLGEQLEISYKEGESAYSFPAIAGAVTAYARQYLWQLITLAGVDNTFYTDTDSLITNSEGSRNLLPRIDPLELGMLKIEDYTNRVVIYGAKDYEFGPTIVHKGVPAKSELKDDGKWHYDHFRGVAEWLKDGLPVGVKISRQSKARKSTYDKGTIANNGRVLPFRLGES